MPHKDLGPTKTREKMISPRTTRITLSTLCMFCFMVASPIKVSYIKTSFEHKSCFGFEKMELPGNLNMTHASSQK
jgi:hypothetical protein